MSESSKQTYPFHFCKDLVNSGRPLPVYFFEAMPDHLVRLHLIFCCSASNKRALGSEGSLQKESAN